MDKSTQKYLLFSPVSGNDPSANHRDGSLIHICRFYKPEVVFLYLSKEMCEKEDLDNRYEDHIKRLSAANNFPCKVDRKRDEELDSPHTFDAFYKVFDARLNKLSNQYPEHQILLNLSSGTPQMQAALHVISVFSNKRFIGIQVSTPQRGENRRPDPFGKPDVEWANNKDNLTHDPENRTRVVTTTSLNAMLKYEIIRNMIDNYNYDAALIVANTIPDYMDKTAVALIKAGVHRLKQELSLASKCLDDVEYELFPVKSTEPDKRQIAFEYILMLQVKSKKGEIADFLRAISPLLTVLFEMYLSKECEVNMLDYYSDEYPPKILRSKLHPCLKSILDAKFNKFRNNSPSAANLSVLIEKLGSCSAADLAVKLTTIENKARHTVAHEIKEATADWLFKQTGCHSLHEICEMLKSFYLIMHAQNPEDWNSYQMLNEKIKSCIPIAASQ